MARGFMCKVHKYMLIYFILFLFFSLNIDTGCFTKIPHQNISDVTNAAAGIFSEQGSLKLGPQNGDPCTDLHKRGEMK